MRINGIGCLCCEPENKVAWNKYCKDCIDYYNKLQESELFQGTLVPYTILDSQATAGDVISYLKCLKCACKYLPDNEGKVTANCTTCKETL